MTQQFLNSPSIEEAYEAYLTRWHLPSVQESWTDKAGRVRRPSLAQFTKRFASDYEKRQRFLAKRDGSTNGAQLAVAERDDVRQQLAELLTRQAQPRMLMWWMLTRILPVTFCPNAVAGVKEL